MFFNTQEKRKHVSFLSGLLSFLLSLLQEVREHRLSHIILQVVLTLQHMLVQVHLLSFLVNNLETERWADAMLGLQDARAWSLLYWCRSSWIQTLRASRALTPHSWQYFVKTLWLHHSDSGNLIPTFCPGNIQGQVGQGSEERGQVEDVPAHCRGVGLGDLSRALPTQHILWLTK